MATIEIESPADLAAIIPDDGGFYEIIDGEVREKPVGASEVVLANLLAYSLNQAALGRGLGLAVVEVLLRLRPNDRTQRQPDLVFVSSDRWPRSRPIPPGNAWQVVPDLVAEVVSPTNLAQEIEDKVAFYLGAGVGTVWIIYPPSARIYVHEGPNSVRVVTREGELDGGAVLPGFRLPMAELFPVQPESTD